MEVLSGERASSADLFVEVVDSFGLVMGIIGGEGNITSAEFSAKGALLFHAIAPIDEEDFEHKAIFAIRFTVLQSAQAEIAAVVGSSGGSATVFVSVYEAPDVVIMNPQVY